MQPKHNKQLVPLAKQLRKEMTKEERHLWYDFLRSYPVRTSTKRILPVKNLTGRINCFTDTRLKAWEFSTYSADLRLSTMLIFLSLK